MAEKKDRSDSRSKVVNSIEELIKANPGFGIVYELFDDEGSGSGFIGPLNMHEVLHKIDELKSHAMELAKEHAPNDLKSYMAEGFAKNILGKILKGGPNGISGILKDMPDGLREILTSISTDSDVINLNNDQYSEHPPIGINELIGTRQKKLTHNS
jgi:hypothetical protein